MVLVIYFFAMFCIALILTLFDCAPKSPSRRIRDRYNKMNKLKHDIKTEADRDALIQQLQSMTFEKELPSKWEDLETVDGFFVNSFSKIKVCMGSGAYTTSTSKNIFKTESQAKSALAKAQLSQLMAVYNDGWEPDWSRENRKKYTIKRSYTFLVVGSTYVEYRFLALKTADLRDKFFENHEALIKEYFEL